MKKVLLSVAVVAAFASCGGPSICDCVNAEGEKTEECKALDKKYEEASDEDKKKMEEEAEKCEADAKKDGEEKASH